MIYHTIYYVSHEYDVVKKSNLECIHHLCIIYHTIYDVSHDYDVVKKSSLEMCTYLSYSRICIINDMKHVAAALARIKASLNTCIAKISNFGM